MDEDGIPVGKVHPRFLDSNSNIHTWAFSAIAELIDNAYDPDVKAKEVRISKRVIEDQVCLMVKDNGKGMTRETLHNMMSFGYNDKDKCATVRHAAVGQYGNGFKSGAMRLGKDALVFTRQENTLSVGLLSQTYLKDIKADNVRVPMVTWNISDKVRCIGGETSLNVILKHSIFKAEEDLLRELAGIERTGTTIIIYNLCRRSDGVMELDFESDLSDIRDPETYLRDVNAEATASTSNIQKRRYMESLKEYCKILYLKPRMKIYIQGKVVRTLLIRKSLRRSQEDNYKPSWANGAKIPITFGFTSPRLDDYGVMLYHKNRLILAYEKVGCQKQTNDIGKDVIAVVEANPIKVVNNKQDFVRDANYSTLMDNISKKLKDYWNVKNGKDVDPMEDNLTNNDGSVNHVQCDNCNKWRWLHNGVREEDLPEKWYCRLNDDFRYNRCDIEEEEEDENKRDEQIRAFQKMKKKTPKGPKKKPENQSSQLVNNPEEIPVALQESTDERQVQLTNEKSGVSSKMAAEVATENVLKLFKVQKMKAQQKQILSCILNGTDCLAVLPTGFGKSLPYQMAVSVKKEMAKLQGREEFTKKVVVCCPLIALMKDQVDRLRNIPGIRAVYRDGSPESDSIIAEGLFDYLFAPPELLVGDKAFRELLQQSDVATIVVDEFHTIACWGEKDNDDREAFRKWFSYLGELRSVFPSSSVVALSATCTKKISKRVRKVLDLKEDTVEIRISPDKPNIKLVVNKVPNCVHMAMAWMIDTLETFPRTIIYCNTIKDVSKIYTYLTTEVPYSSSYCEMFHSETPEAVKQRIIDDLCNANSMLRVVIATSALGMGVDITNVSSVILYGAPKQVVDIIQQTGRAGRDGSQSIAMLLYNSFHLRNVEVEVKNVYTSKSCRRKALLSPFLTVQELETVSIFDNKPSHFCCDICASLCKCQSCAADLLPLEKIFESITDENTSAELHSESDEDSDATEPYNYDDYFQHSVDPDEELE